jgi:hypothetical protein
MVAKENKGMKVYSNYRKLTAIFSVAVFMLFGFLVSINEANAQTRKKTTKKQTTKKQSRPSSIPQPVPQQNEPAIISRAEDFQNQNQQIITGTETPVQTETQTETSVETPVSMDDRLKEISDRIKSLESSQRNEYDEKQKRLLLNLDILTKAEQRSESLRKQIFEMVEKENSVRTKLEQIGYDLRPEMIERHTSFAGSLRPEELRDMRRKNLEAEKRNLETLLTEIQNNRANLEASLQKADALVEKLRAKLEKDIDAALTEEPK